MDTDVFYEVVVPLLLLDRTALICISTILARRMNAGRVVDERNRALFPECTP